MWLLAVDHLMVQQLSYQFSCMVRNLEFGIRCGDMSLQDEYRELVVSIRSQRRFLQNLEPLLTDECQFGSFGNLIKHLSSNRPIFHKEVKLLAAHCLYASMVLSLRSFITLNMGIVSQIKTGGEDEQRHAGLGKPVWLTPTKPYIA